MEAKVLPSPHPLHSSFSFSRRPSCIRIQPLPVNSPINLRLSPLHAAGPAANSTEETDSNDETKADAAESATPPQPRPQISIRYRARSKRQARKQQEQQTVEAPPPKKDWESMTLAEKALELYVGEKGLLFWLNKSAYASIFIIIGGWILFRFVGPSLGLYQLDAPPLSPTSVLKGSP